MSPHPAKFSKKIIEELSLFVPFSGKKVLDPFSGTGKLKQIVYPQWLYLNEIEPEWAIQGLPAHVTIGDAQRLPYPNNFFDIIATSPTYGNRMADHHNARDKSKRNTYKHTLGRDLHPANSGQMHWGIKYKALHVEVWAECKRLLKSDGLLILNISDHIKNGKPVQVSNWHLKILKFLGFSLIDSRKIETPRNKFGANSHLRAEYENLFVFRMP